MADLDNNNADQDINNDNNVNDVNNVNSADIQSNIQNNNQSDNQINSESNNQSQYNKVPEYSFWAEQVPNNTYSNNNQNNNWEQANNVNRNNYYNNQGNPGQNNQYQNNQYQNNPFQSNPYQNNPYQYNNYQNNPYQNYVNQNNPYQNNPYQSNAYVNYTNQEKKKKEKKPLNKGVKFIIKAACFGIIAGLSFFGLQQAYFAIDPNAPSRAILASGKADSSYEIGYTDQGTVQTSSKTIISDVAGNTLPAIVSINCLATQTTQFFGQSYDQQVQGSGSGIIVGKNDKELLIATNNHVVEGATDISVTFADGTQADAIIKGTDSTADLAVVTVDISKLKDDTLKAISVAKLGNSDNVKVGEMVVAIGNALGYGQSVTVGYVSAKDREVDVSDAYNNSKKMVLLQTDAAINPGNSGGALLNTKGEVIGINTVKYASSEVEGMGYAIPISKATPIIDDLMTRQVLSEAEKGYLGITGVDVTEVDAANYNMPVGVFVGEVSQGGAAEKAGIKAEDIITGADDLTITSITQLREYVNSHKVGTEVKIKYMRNSNGKYEEGTVTVTLGKNPSLPTN